MTASATTSTKPRALIGWRVLALVYDLLPVLALWFLISAIFTVGYTFIGHHAARENIQPFSLLQWLLWLICWLVSGVYAVLSWKRGGQTLGMRPWRLYVTAASGGAASSKKLWLRYAIGTLSLLLVGAGFWWAWIDRDRLTWHDRVSGTRMVRKSKTTH